MGVYVLFTFYPKIANFQHSFVRKPLARFYHVWYRWKAKHYAENAIPMTRFSKNNYFSKPSVYDVYTNKDDWLNGKSELFSAF